MRKPTAVRSRLTFLPLRLLIGIADLLPWRARLAFGSALMRAAVASLPKYRRRVEANLRLILPDLDAGARRGVRRGMAGNFGRTIVEILDNRGFHARADWIAPTGPGAAALLEAARGGGAVLVTGHFGQWEAGRAWLLSQGVSCAGVYREIDNPHLNTLYVDNLEAGGPVFPKNRSGVRGMVRHLAKGGVLAILADQYEKRGTPLDFVGRPAPTTLVPAELALKFGLPLIPIYGRRLPDGVAVQVEVDPPIPRGSAAQMMQAANDSLAERVRRVPEQYYWLHRRWVKAP